MIVHSSLLVQSKQPDRAVRSCSRRGSSRISLRCFSSKNDKNIIMAQSSQTRRSYCPMVETACNSHSMSLVGYPAHPQGSHEEADTLLAFHASSVARNAMIRASDTDVSVILQGMIGRHLTSQRPTAYSCIIMDCGSGNISRHIDISSIANALEAKQKRRAAAMPGPHAFTGSDFTIAFYRKGKIKPREVLEKDTEGTLIQLKGYVKDVNEARHVKLCQMTVKMDKVLVYLCYMGLLLLGKENKST